MDEEEQYAMKTPHEGNLYKYLGIEQCKRTSARIVREIIRNELSTKKINQICKSGLNGAATIKTMNTYAAVSVLTYSFGVIKWSYTDLEALQRKMRTMLTNHRYHHTRAAMGRTGMPRKEGGRGITDAIS